MQHEEELKAPPLDVPPPPPKQEEFFPGFRLEASNIARSSYQAQKRVGEAGKALEKVKGIGKFQGIPFPFRAILAIAPFSDPRGLLTTEEKFQQMLQESQDALLAANAEYTKFSWRQQVIWSLPYLLIDRDSGVRSIDDVNNVLPNEFFDDSDQAWLTGIWGKLSNLIPPELPPEYQGTPGEIRTQLLEDILSEPKLELRGVHHLTIDELIKSFAPQAPELPPGMDTAAVRDILGDLEFDEETQAEIEDLHKLTEDLQNDWRIQVAYMELMRAGTVQVEEPELTPVEFLKMLGTQPMLATLELLEKYFNMLPRPLAALAITSFPRIRKDSDAAKLDDLYNQYRDLGEGWWEAHSLAYQDWGMNIWLKMVIELSFDPLNLVGFGVFTKITKPLPYVGRFVGAVERGWLELWDLPFKGARDLIKRIPKTPTQQAGAIARQAFMDTRALLRQMLGDDVSMVGRDELVNTLRFAVDQAMDMPHELGNQAVRVGRYLTDYDFFEEAAVKGFFREAGVTVDVSKQLVHDFNRHFDLFFRKTRVANEIAAELLVQVGKEPVGTVLNKFVSVLERQKARIVKEALDMIDVGSAKGVLESVLRNTEAMGIRKAASPVYKFARQTGMSTSWAARGVDRYVHMSWVNWIDRQVTAPMANHYLLFTAYGPMNVIETSMRSFLGAGEVFYPRMTSPVDEVVRIGSGLSTLPFEFIQFQKGLGRLEMSVVNPQTGKTIVFGKGRLPGITKPLPETILGVKLPQLNIKIGTKSYPMRSWQDWNDMFGDIGNQQRAWYYLTKYKQKLWQEAPEEMAQLAKVFDDAEPLLNDIAYFTKRERVDLERVLQQDATVGPDMVRQHNVPLLEAQRRKALYEINKLMDKMPDIYSLHKNTIRDEIMNGKMFKDVDGRMAAIKDSVREFNVVSLQAEANAFDQLVKDFAEFVPETSDDILRTMGFISDLTEAVSDRISDVRKITQRRAAQLTPTEADDFYLGSSEVLAEFIGKSKESVDEMLEQFGKAVRDTGMLDENQLSILDRLTKATQLRHANALSTRDLDRRIINEAVAATPRKDRGKAFWDNLEAKRSREAWEPYWVKEEGLFESVEDIKNRLMVDLGVTPDAPVSVPEVVDKLTPAHVAYLLGVTGDDLNRGLTKVGAMITIRPKNKFINWVYSRSRKVSGNLGKTPEDIGFSREAIGEVYDQMFQNLGIDPRLVADEPLFPAMAQLEELRQEITRISGISKIPQNDYVKFQKYINTVADELGKLPMNQAEGAGDWLAKKESAMTNTRTQYEMDFTDYDNRNAVDAAMRTIFPFWTYEWQRFFWLPRTFLRTPGVGTGVGRYVEYSDQGYTPIPGTDIQFNPLRGTVFMGGFRRMYMRDFPEYYDAFPGMEIIDYIGRAGFYPGLPTMLPIVAFGALTGKPEWGELAPAWAKTTLNAARAIAPEQAGKVINHLFPDRFRDYLTMLTLAEAGEDADEIWRKKSSGAKITEEEERLWLRAGAKATGLKGMLFEQTGMFRMRPEEMTQLHKDMAELLEEVTGVPVKIQDIIRRRQAVTGKRFSDYFKLDSLQQKILYQSEAYRRWQGVTTPLYPSAWQQEDVDVRNFYERVDELFTDARHKGIFDEQGVLQQQSIVELNRQWVSGEIGPDQWLSARGDVLSHASSASMEMGKRDFPDVPKTLDEREARLKERGIPAITYGPDQELLYKYFEIKPILKWDWEAERMNRDFDTYYALIDAMIDTLQGEFRQRFIDRIQFDWTPMERLHWQISREYMRPYRMVRNLVMEQYTPEQVKQIRRFEVARGAERAELQALPGPDGRKLISGYSATLREARQRLRLLDTTMDAWLNFFGTTDTFMSPEAKQINEGLIEQYMTPEMIGGR